jgi:CubicO group peptidase (beta-lactamase class C family)
MLQEYADRAVADGHVGIVIGLIRHGGTEWASAGITGRGGMRPDDRTVFRLASVSKVFTATALAVAVTRGEIALDDKAFGAVTYRQLATHTSGMPRGDVTLLQALAAIPAGHFEYSNTGVAALGALLGPAYEEIIRERIGLPDISTVLDVGRLRRLAPGHDANGNLVVTPTYPEGAPAGGLYGTIADLLEFLRQYLQPDAAKRLAIEEKLCWMVEDDRIWHNGSLPGYRSYIAFSPRTGTGVAILGNTGISVDELGQRLMIGT